jgi:uncharacterized protein
VARELRRLLGWLMTSWACAPGVDLGAGSGDCGSPHVPVHDIQGAADESPLSGQRLSVEGLVTGLELGPEPGVFLEAEFPDQDPRSSEGLYVSLGSLHSPPRLGARIRARGQVRERAGVTELAQLELLQACGQAPIRPTRVEAGAGAAEEEAWESMWVTWRATWTLIDTWRQLAHAEVTASPEGRLYAPGHELAASRVSDLADPWLIEEAALRSEAPEATAREALRLGARAAQVTGIVHLGSGQRRLLATERVDWQSPETPALGAAARGTLRIAALNLDNYFVTLGSRGARSEQELTRQKDKLVALLSGVDADLLALTELESQDPRSLLHLFSALNEQFGADQQYVWSEITPPRASVLRAALAYRPARLRSVNDAWFQSTPSSRRPALAQTFDTGGQRFTSFVVHFKSKRCDAPQLVVEAAGCGAATRLDEARELIAAIEALPPEVDRDHVLVIGDFNADSLEGPLVLLQQAGFVDLLDRVPAEQRYSYVFDARASLLDHALASPGLARTLRGAAIWHVNADEPEFRSYSLDNPPAAYRPDPLRSSDHDPIVVDLAL